ncbi:hypothetical protein DL93DRAFT_2229904 [Clavulina sp. PMI_390]|nr:hypothetical protein DL93DRAFT_2229904 [Clavulina sp. PMI_390]
MMDEIGRFSLVYELYVTLERIHLPSLSTPILLSKPLAPLMPRDPIWSPSRPRRSATARAKPYDHSADSDNDSEPRSSENPRNRPRKRDSCLTCRGRRKGCTSKHDPHVVVGDRPCDECVRLRVECLGWGDQRPLFMKKKAMLDKMKAAIKAHNETHTNASSKPLLSLEGFYQGTAFIPPFPIETCSTLYDRNDSSYLIDPTPSTSSDSEAVSAPLPVSKKWLMDRGSTSKDVWKTVTDHEPLDSRDLDTSINGRTWSDGIAAPHIPYPPRLEMPSPGASVKDAPSVADIDDVRLTESGPNQDTVSFKQYTRASRVSLAPLFPPLSTQKQSIRTPLTLDHDNWLPVSRALAAIREGDSLLSLSHPTHPPSPLPSDPPALPEDATAALLGIITRWADIVRPFSHRYQTQLTPKDIIDFVIRGGAACIEQATLGALKLCVFARSRFTSQPSQASEVIGSQAAIANDIADFLSTQPTDASVLVSAVFGVDLSLLLGGKTGWKEQLKIACEWVLVNWDSIENGFFGPTAAAFLGIVVWYDILAALAQRQAPILKHLLETILAPKSVVQMPRIMGCANRVMLALGKTASFAYRVREEVGTEKLTVREVTHLAQELKHVFTSQDFRDLPSVPAFVSSDELYRLDSLSIGSSDVAGPSTSGTSSFSPSSDSEHIISRVSKWSDHLHSAKDVTYAFSMAGNVHLQAILVEYSHIVNPSVFQPLTGLMNLEHVAHLGAGVLKRIPSNDADRSIVWPLCVIGSVMQDQEHRAWFTARFQAIEGREMLGNVKAAEELMHLVWSRQDRTQREALKSDQPVGQVLKPNWVNCMDGQPVLLA